MCFNLYWLCLPPPLSGSVMKSFSPSLGDIIATIDFGNWYFTDDWYNIGNCQGLHLIRPRKMLWIPYELITAILRQRVFQDPIMMIANFTVSIYDVIHLRTPVVTLMANFQATQRLAPFTMSSIIFHFQGSTAGERIPSGHNICL